MSCVYTIRPRPNNPVPGTRSVHQMVVGSTSSMIRTQQRRREYCGASIDSGGCSLMSLVVERARRDRSLWMRRHGRLALRQGITRVVVVATMDTTTLCQLDTYVFCLLFLLPWWDVGHFRAHRRRNRCWVLNATPPMIDAHCDPHRQHYPPHSY